jgi:hypothetical protein
MTRLLKVFAFASLSLLMVTASAADWKLAASSEKAWFFVDTTSIVKQAKYRKAWVMWTATTAEAERQPKFGESPPAKSSKALYYFDCSSRRSTTVQGTNYSGEAGAGDVLHNYQARFTESMLEDVAPDTVGESLLTFACSKKIKEK